MVLTAAATRLLPHPPNFAPITAMALFAGACFASRWLALFVPLAAMLLSDLALGLLGDAPGFGFHGLMPFVYGSFVLISMLGMRLRRDRALLRLVRTGLAASIFFFVATNLAFWATSPLYPASIEGLMACFVAAIPFFHNALLGDAVFMALLFGGLALAERGMPALRETSLATSG
jgi:hypothetical protein